MKRIFPDFAYGDGPRDGCWWDETADVAPADRLDGDHTCNVVVIGAGFTGLSAALHLLRGGASVTVLEARRIGWGASGRNGGFCCLGGGRASDAALDRQTGKAARLEWRRAERAAVETVDALITDLGIDADRHSAGETCLAHRPRAMRVLRDDVTAIEENYGVTPSLHDVGELERMGMAGPFHGALTIPVGFGLNPRKYLAGLAAAVRAAGGRICEGTAVTGIDGARVTTASGVIRAERILIATNGYSSEDIPRWMAGRYMPTQSTVLVTAPLTAAQRNAQGWTTDQMCYDTRTLLHYFRLMPDGRFLFGMRGGILATPGAEQAARRKVVRDFRRMFPAWADVPVTHCWSGLVCLARDQLPFVGEVPGAPGMLAGFAYHGNGVAMGTFAGKLLAGLALGQTPPLYPQVMARPPRRFPLGTWRRLAIPAAYAAFTLGDMRP